VEDKAFTAKYLPMARLLWEASQGDPGCIPQDYCEHLAHTFIDGDVCLGPLLSKVEEYSELEDFEIEEAIELLGKVSPGDWPPLEDIEGVSLDAFLRAFDSNRDLEELNFVEDNLSTAERVEKVLIEVISSVFGDKVSTIRSEKGYFANPKNNFLQDDDGTFQGTFMYDGNKFMFEVAPAEDGWICTYRLHWDSVDKLPPKHDEDKEEVTDYTRRVRHRGWK
jgi:hypothetical protein